MNESSESDCVALSSFLPPESLLALCLNNAFFKSRSRCSMECITSCNLLKC